MSYETTLRNLDKPYTTLEIVDKFPFKNHWRNNPLSQTTWIDPRRAGYRPYKSTFFLQQRFPLENDCGSYYQTSCDIILPVNRCYRENPGPVSQP